MQNPGQSLWGVEACAGFKDCSPKGTTPAASFPWTLFFEEQKRKIDGQIAGLRASLTGEPSTTVAEPAKGKMSAAGRMRMAAAQQKRWAAVKGEVAAPVKKTSKPKRKLSAAKK